ncbi:MAG: hypothetical protein I8H66_13620 [Sphingobacteriia bacterium]|nr:hypothetical protein [Sphingobacteriia bacterium]
MSLDQEDNSELEASFNQFITELNKSPVSKAGALEMEQLFFSAMRVKPEHTDQPNNTSSAHSNDAEILHGMQKLLNAKQGFILKEVPEKAARWASFMALSAAGILFITVGFVLITTPASPEFEIATIFYFNEFDGFTVMDMFALVIIFVGIFFFIRAFTQRKK